MNYKTLESVWSNNPTDNFQVTPAKLCEGGTYMTNGGPNEKMCQKMWSTKDGKSEISKYNCVEGKYNGRPVHFEFTPMSSPLWRNEMCNPPILSKNSPKVL